MLLVQIEAKRVLLARDDLSDGVPDHSAPFATRLPAFAQPDPERLRFLAQSPRTMVSTGRRPGFGAASIC